MERGIPSAVAPSKQVAPAAEKRKRVAGTEATPKKVRAEEADKAAPLVDDHVRREDGFHTDGSRDGSSASDGRRWRSPQRAPSGQSPRAHERQM